VNGAAREGGSVAYYGRRVPEWPLLPGASVAAGSSRSVMSPSSSTRPDSVTEPLASTTTSSARDSAWRTCCSTMSSAVPDSRIDVSV